MKMFSGRGSNTIVIAVIFTLLIVIVPVNAYSIALYGTNTGFNPELHKDSVTVLKSLPGSPGSDLDSHIDQFVQADVILIGGEDSFSSATAAKLEAAAAEGKILVIAYPANHKFDASLPAPNGGTSAGGQSLEIADPTSAIAKEVFAKLKSPFPLQGAAPDKEQAVPKSGTVTLLNFDTGMPALMYGKYGKGYIIEWTTVPAPSYMDQTTADTILSRLIPTLLPPAATTPATTAPATTIPTTTAPAATAAVATTTTVNVTVAATTAVPSATPTAAPAAVAGTVEMYSSPSGASILIDGIYYGTTPTKLTGIEQGKHVYRLTMSGYNDFVDSIDVVAGETRKGYGTLQPINQVTAAATAVPIVVPVVTQAPTETQPKSIWENSSVIVAIIGVLTAAIAAGATIFTHTRPPKKE